MSAPDGLASMSPAWVLYVVRFAKQVTFDRSSTSIGNRSVSTDPQAAMAERPALVITDDCVQMQTSSLKGQHTTGLSANLLPSMEYLREILPGDWVMAWMVNSQEKANDLAARLTAKKPCNDFMDGLKYMGRVEGLRKIISVQRDTGTRTISYGLQSNGFGEWDNQILYFPELEILDQKNVGVWLSRLGTFFGSLVTAQGGTLDINKILPTLARLLLGDGLPVGAINLDMEKNERLRVTANNDQPVAGLVPDSIGKVLGRTPKVSRSGMLTYLDLFECIFGVQKYDASSPGNSYTNLLPANLEEYEDTGTSETIFRYTNKPLAGEFTPSPFPFDNTPIWQILQTYLNPAVNEMFLALRANPNGKILPILTVRQLPFSTIERSQTFVPDNQESGIKALTTFEELPRWYADDSLIVAANIGTSNAPRFNVVQVIGNAPGINLDPTFNFVRNPPVRDDLDVMRSGVRMYARTVNCHLNDAQTNAKAWTNLVSDFTMGQHLMLTGTISLVGVQAPICVGDNFEYGGTVYHIEGVNHSCGIDFNGYRFFETTLQLTHGMTDGDIAKTGKLSETQFPTLSAKAQGAQANVTIER